MTIETRYSVEPDDLLAVRFECSKCGSAISVPITSQLSVYAQSIGNATCRVCHTSFGISGGSEEHTTLLQLALGLENIAKMMKTRSLKISLEVKGSVKP